MQYALTLQRPDPTHTGNPAINKTSKKKPRA
ncbi:hypothetical protein EHW99_0312 [Erwinia amylovora]|uniref:Uncharacterized protein n=2 Tax=Erwinia amylovora TaxID=552 RepID=D4I2A0_ERWAC|nr:hypothetical protein EHX00_0312 [Erwinia amylovora]CBA23415.1 hypothetical protein predicted by Glimmer/Critica [Erwinia amylovora CFBP1430]CBX82190.1 hypothetical protein predicted by Glimmer/Critica [Erwinia amylovora ATCC BAA-2158]QJQ56717.1 hypothetical protein EHW99_0312 [Erwinia amylovora]QJQ60416.1 hypothetical protein EHW98_0312 [Erwinia amylovora]